MTMIGMMRRHGVVRTAIAAGLLALATSAGGCGLLDASDPTKLEEQDMANATGADLMRRQALLSMDQAEGPMVWYGGLLADEFQITPENPNTPELKVDQRLRDATPSTLFVLSSRFSSPFRLRHQSRYEATLALRNIESYTPESARAAYVGQMLTVRAYSVVRLGEDFCPGFPLHELDGFAPVYGPPLTIVEVFERAVTDLDSAVVLAVDSARILNFARIVRGRALLNLGRFAEAGTAVTGVPTDYVFTNESGLNYFDFSYPPSGDGVADHEGGNGLDFVSANDPRVRTTLWGTAVDGTTQLYRPDKYPDYTTPIVTASGIEARLIEAEAQLQASPDQPQWITTLNTLRTTGNTLPDGTYEAGTGGVAGLAPLTDPGTAEARVDLVFRERAFWLFGTGHRLGDLRRLIRVYERSSEAVFPTGPYGTATSLPFPDPESEKGFSPGVTGCASQ